MDALHDDETGFLNEDFLRALVPGRVATARRLMWPLSLAILDIEDDSAVEVLAHAILVTVRECDTACRMDDGRFAMLLEDTPENGAVWVVERVRRLLGAQTDPVSVWAGVATYPAHAMDGPTLLDVASQTLDAACEWDTPRIEVAVPPS
jgi:GGDEF domain-containing protein